MEYPDLGNLLVYCLYCSPQFYHMLLLPLSYSYQHPFRKITVLPKFIYTLNAVAGYDSRFTITWVTPQHWILLHIITYFLYCLKYGYKFSKIKSRKFFNLTQNIFRKFHFRKPIIYICIIL